MNRNNVVSINRKRDNKFSGFSAYSGNKRRTLEEKFLLFGTLASLMLFQIVCIATFNFPQAALFAGSAIIGIIAGIIMHYLFPAQIKSYFDLREVPLPAPVRKGNLQRAA